jgi:hypothetical protein
MACTTTSSLPNTLDNFTLTQNYVTNYSMNGNLGKPKRTKFWEYLSVNLI